MCTLYEDQHIKTATVFCKDCDEYMCDAFKNPHTVYNIGEHDIVIFQNKKSVPVLMDMKGTDKCPEHGREIEFFCQDHLSYVAVRVLSFTGNVIKWMK
ncbi:hypothetical protein DPMN_132122 [Dreissena polymorpha]|uniref:Uncharacterized protein n=1 Tax=Dreissena polymorpha TaxID=45954 RepID=A0A9D4FXQ5_DREPO|nr:hypothetical protein DPMN_132122 [Dreissena polymorpha]